MLRIGDRELDIDQVAPKLYQGGRVDPSCAYDGFSMIVLCAQELQPELPRFRGKMVRPAFDDTIYPSTLEMARAAAAVQAVTREISRGGRVLVTCRAGLNRSGLVVGLALGRLTGMHAERIVAMVRKARGVLALSNPTFARIVRAMASTPTHQVRIAP